MLFSVKEIILCIALVLPYVAPLLTVLKGKLCTYKKSTVKFVGHSFSHKISYGDGFDCNKAQ
jgi:hypothetical protein